jgi:wyosine [tRNA(Phe)-imidazoG37] synthetase (radical SAM superfamily)
MTTTVSSPIIQGPVRTQRWDSVLAIDLTPTAPSLLIGRGEQLPRASLVVTSVARRVIDGSRAGEKVRAIVVLGTNGDPSVHPGLREISENLVALRNKWYPRAKLVILTDGHRLNDPEVRRALGYYDRPTLPLDWGTSKAFTRMTKCKGPELGQRVHAMAGFEKIHIQIRFVRGPVDNTSESELKGIIKRLLEIRPTVVEILTEGVTVSNKRLKPFTPKRMESLADEIAEATGLKVTIHEETSPV